MRDVQSFILESREMGIRTSFLDSGDLRSRGVRGDTGDSAWRVDCELWFVSLDPDLLNPPEDGRTR